MDSWGGSQSNPSQYVYPWGTFDQRPIDAISFWLKNKVDAGFVTFDGDNSNRDGVLLQGISIIFHCFFIARCLCQRRKIS